MSSGKHHHFRSGEKIPKTTFGLPRKSVDREELVQPIRFTADSQYYNRRVHTQNNDNDDFEFTKTLHRLGLGGNTINQKILSHLSKNQKDLRKYESVLGTQKQKRNQGNGIQVPKAGLKIVPNNIYQNISTFSDLKSRKEPSKVMLTEVGAKISSSKDKLAKRDNKRLFERLLLNKDKSLKPQVNQNKSKEARQKFISGNLKQKPFYFNKQNNQIVERMTFKQGKSTNMRQTKDSHKEKHMFDIIDNKTTRETKTLKTEPCQIAKRQIQILQKVGQGTFGEVFKAKMGNNIVAIKKVYQDKKYKNRQLQILNMINNDFVLKIIDTFHTQQAGKKGQPPKDYLNVIMEYYGQNLFQVNLESQEALSEIELKLFMYQLFRGLMYIHSLQICHRDIKPQNILIDRKGGKLVICDFGSAKKLIKGDCNIAYICSRCYRAPQLIFGCTNYTTMIDIWSAGCVLLELLTGQPFFIGDSNIGQLVEIIKTLGTPSKTQVVHMNPDYDLDDYKFPKIKTKPWKQIFPKINEDLESLLKQLMIYSPKQRLNAAQALCHQYFDQLRQESTYRYLRQKKQIKSLFDFTKQQLRGNQHLSPKLIPDWYQNQFSQNF